MEDCAAAIGAWRFYLENLGPDDDATTRAKTDPQAASRRVAFDRTQAELLMIEPIASLG